MPMHERLFIAVPLSLHNSSYNRHVRGLLVAVLQKQESGGWMGYNSSFYSNLS